MYHLIQTDYNVDLYRRRRMRKLLRNRMRTRPKLWMNHRLGIFTTCTVPSLLNQTCQNWSWVIRVDHRTPEEDLESIVRAVGGRASITTDEWDVVVSSICDNLDVPLLTTRLDNDDMFHHNAFELIQDEARGSAARCVIDIPGGYGYDTDSRRLYKSDKFINSGDVTHFSSLFEPTPPFEGISKYPRHKELGALFPVVNIDGRWWVEVWHQLNIKNRPLLRGEVSFENLFILCPPRQGSTILYKLLWTSPNISTLLGKSSWAGEGQFVAGAKKFFGDDHWNTNVNWAGIKKVWDREWNLSKPILCEKSPSNICRAKSMESFFGQFAPVFFICMIRSPYARTHMSRWVEGADYQRRNMKQLNNVFRLTYEELTNDLDSVSKRLLRFIPKLKTLDKTVKYVPGIDNAKRHKSKRNKSIRNMNPKNTLEEIRHKNKILRKHTDLLEFHGYRLLDD